MLNVYFYALYDAEARQAYSGMTVNVCASAVREDIRGNFRAPRYITVRRVPELAGIEEGGYATIVPRAEVSTDVQDD